MPLFSHSFYQSTNVGQFDEAGKCLVTDFSGKFGYISGKEINMLFILTFLGCTHEKICKKNILKSKACISKAVMILKSSANTFLLFLTN